MRLFKGKRKRWLYFAQKKKTSYAKNKLRNTCTKDYSPFPHKKLKHLHHFEHQLHLRKCPHLNVIHRIHQENNFLTTAIIKINVINNLIDEFSVLDISDCKDNSGLNAFRYTDTLTSSDVPSNRESSNVDKEFEKLIPSVLNELERNGKGDLLQKFFSQVSCGKIPLNNIAFLSSPHLCFIIVFICDLFVSRDDPLMS